MAIDIESAFPGRSNSGTPAYPNGSFRNRSSETAEDGTYLRADWANDIFGFLSRLLDEASITPDGDPDTVLDSQYFTALESVIQAVVDSGDIQEEIRDVMGATLVAGDGIDITVNDPGNTITVTAESASRTNPGISELATDIETAAASDTDLVISVSALASLFGTSTRTGSNTVTRTPILVGGVFVEQIVQTGVYSGLNGSVVFPLEFPTAITHCNLQPTHNVDIGNGKAAVTNLKASSTTGFSFSSGVESGTSDTFSQTDLDGTYYAVGY